MYNDVATAQQNIIEPEANGPGSVPNVPQKHITRPRIRDANQQEAGKASDSAECVHPMLRHQLLDV